MAKPACIAVQHGLAITAYGAVNPCCASKDFKHITEIDNLLDYVRNDKGLERKRAFEIESKNWLDECLGCKDKSNRGLMSRKDKMINWFPDGDEKWSAENKDAYVHMDISFGNTCSQQCIMCNSKFSSKWLKHDLELYQEQKRPGGANNVMSRNLNTMLMKNWSLTYEHLDQIASLVSEETKIIEIKGGEPLYDKRFNYFVQAVLQRNKDVKISTNTNGIHFSKKTIDMLNDIKKLNIDISYDGTGKIYEWIRSSKWDLALENFKRCLSHLRHSPTLNYTTMMYNVDHFETYYNWAADMAEKYDRRIPIHFTQVVTSPKHIGPVFASKDRIKNGISQLEMMYDDPRDAGASDSRIYKPRVEKLIGFLKTCYDDNPHEYDKGRSIEAHNWLAKVRGWDIKDYADM